MNKAIQGMLAAIAMLLILALSGCNSEVARVQIQSEGSFEYSFNHDGSPVTAWTDLDIEYVDQPSLRYWITFASDSQTTDTVECDPLDSKQKKMERKASVRGVTKESYLGEMMCEISIPEGEINAVVNFESVGSDVSIFRADLVIRGED